MAAVWQGWIAGKANFERSLTTTIKCWPDNRWKTPTKKNISTDLTRLRHGTTIATHVDNFSCSAGKWVVVSLFNVYPWSLFLLKFASFHSWAKHNCISSQFQALGLWWRSKWSGRRAGVEDKRRGYPARRPSISGYRLIPVISHTLVIGSCTFMQMSYEWVMLIYSFDGEPGTGFNHEFQYVCSVVVLLVAHWSTQWFLNLLTEKSAVPVT